MTLPFSEQQFFDVFGRYNTRVWPVVLLLWITTVWFVVQLVRARSRSVVTRRIEFVWGHTARHKFAAVFIVYSLLYPLLVLASGHGYPRAPLFAVPCPTTLFTCGVLLTAVPRVPVGASVVPVAWTVIAGSAAILLDVPPDAMLFIAGAAVVITAIAQRRRPSPLLFVSTCGTRRP